MIRLDKPYPAICAGPLGSCPLPLYRGVWMEIRFQNLNSGILSGFKSQFIKHTLVLMIIFVLMWPGDALLLGSSYR